MPSKKIILDTSLAVILALSIGAAYWQYGWHRGTAQETQGETAPVVADEAPQESTAPDTPKTPALAPAEVPEGWNVYVSKGNWGDGTSIAFAYPPGWTLEENYVTSSSYDRWHNVYVTGGQLLDSVTLVWKTYQPMGGYEITIDKKGRDGSPDWTTRDVGGYNARMWVYRESEAIKGSVPADGLDYGTTFAVQDIGFIIKLRTSDPTKQIFDQIISTINFGTSS